jgi:ferredoxin
MTSVNKEKRRIPILSPVTREFVRSAWRAQTNKPWDFLHSYVYARWPYLYIALGNGEHPITKMLKPLARGLRLIFRNNARKTPGKTAPLSFTRPTGTIADIYHGKVMPLESARELVMVSEPIDLPDLEQVIPYVRARAIIQQNPDHILLMQCPCRSSRENPCRPLDVCMVIGQPFVDFTQQHYPSRGRRITQREALEVLERENRRGRVHHAFFSAMMLGRFFAICNCCQCCCSAMASHRRGTPVLASSGYVSQADEALCIGCDPGPEYCQFGALSARDSRCQVDEEKCMGCGLCVNRCPQGAISLRREPDRGEPLEICSLTKDSSGRVI